MSIATIADIETLEWELRRYNPARVPDVNKSSVSLAAASELLTVLRYHKGRDLREAIRTRFSTCSVWDSAQQLLTGRLRVADGATVFSKMPARYEEEWFTTEMRNFRKALLAKRFPIDLSASLTGGVFEIVDNVWRHSDAPGSGVLSYRIVDRAFSFAVSDTGVGVLTSLKRNRKYAGLSTSLEALEEAIKPSVSRFQNGSGLGFNTLVRALANLWGQTRLRSGEAVLLFNRESDVPNKTQYFVPFLPGLQVSGVCRLSKPI